MSLKKFLFIVGLAVLTAGVVAALAEPAAAQILSWDPYPDAAEGFFIERAAQPVGGGACGTFGQIAFTGIVTTYRDVDPTLRGGITYCYRIRAFQGITSAPTASSPYSNVATWAKPLAAPVLRVTVATLNRGSGTVTSEPAGINCGRSRGPCEARFTEGAQVALTAARHPSSIFAGWGGPDGCQANYPKCLITLTADDASASATFTHK